MRTGKPRRALGNPERTEGGHWRRIDRRNGVTLGLWCAGPGDISPPQNGYDSRCTACWLNHSHTADAHHVAVQWSRGRKDG
jgi:hypothetical protein